MADPRPQSLASRLGWLGIASCALDLLAVYWKAPVVRPGVTTGDLVDLLTPVILIFFYALVLASLGGASGGGRAARLLFVIGGIGIVLGHGVHAAANSIDDAIARARAVDPAGLADWWDEHLSHTMIHASKALLCVALTTIESRRAPSGSRSLLLIVGALAYGFITFAEGIEGQTTAILFPFVVLYLAWSLGRGRSYAPVRLFYTLAAAVSILLFAFWGLTHHGFPEFSAVGLIPQPR